LLFDSLVTTVGVETLEYLACTNQLTTYKSTI